MKEKLKNLLKKEFFPVLILFLVSLIPLLWYKPGTIALGHDMGWSLLPTERFVERFYTWSPTDFGADYSLYMGSVTFYGIEAFFSFIGMSIIWVQKTTFIFWFFAMAISMYYLCRTLYKGKGSRSLAVIASFFYIINHFTLHDWIIAEFSKWSIMTFFPIALALIWRAIDKKITIPKFAALIGIFSLFFNGGGASGLPLYGGLFSALLLLFFYKWLVEKKLFTQILKVYFIFLVVIIFVNLYWIIPLVSVITSQYSPFAQSGGPEGAVAWTNVISANASFMNLFRLQGFSSWYDDPNHPYAAVFLQNPIFIFGSILFPLLVFLALLFVRNKEEKKIVLFFSFLVLISIFFTAGTHSPLGFIYEFMMKNIYGFAIFRTAFYKFGYVLWFAYGFLFAFSIIKIANHIPKISKILVIISIVFLSIYNYPFFTGSFFNFDKPFTTMVSLPSYVIDAKDFIQKLPADSRILLIPPPAPVDGQTDIYNFGYFSRTPLPFQLTQKSVVTNVEVNSDPQEKFTEALYSAFLTNDEQKAKKIIQMLGVTDLLIRNDVMLFHSKYIVTSPDLYVKNLTSYKWLNKEKTFGKWEFYKVDISNSQISINTPNIHIVSGDNNNSFLQKIAIDSPDDNIIVSSDYQQVVPNYHNLTSVASCVTCEMLDNKNLPEVSIRILPTSPFYPLVTFKEDKNLKSAEGNDFLYLRLLLIYSEKRALELSQLFKVGQGITKSEKLDEQKRFLIFKNYEDTLGKIQTRYDKLSLVQKLQIVDELIASIENQKIIVEDLRKSISASSIESNYYSLISALNNLSLNKEFKKDSLFKANNDIYTLTIPEDGNYTLNIKNDLSRSETIDARAFLSGDEIYLSKGDHPIDILNMNNSQIIKDKITLDENNPNFNFSDFSLDTSSRYLVSFDYLVKKDSSLNVFLKDGDSDVDNESIQVSPYIKNYEFSFTTDESIKKKYVLNISLDNPTRPGTIVVSNLKIQKYSSAIISATKINNFQNENFSLPSITGKFVDPTRYIVTVRNAKSPFVLLFKQTFSPDWQAKFSDGTIARDHFPANFAFNGWYLNKTGNYTIELNFSLQKYYYYGLALSAFSLIFLVALLLKKNRL